MSPSPYSKTFDSINEPSIFIKFNFIPFHFSTLSKTALYAVSFFTFGSFMILNFYSRTLYTITVVHAAFVCFRSVLKVPSGRSYIILVTLTLWNRNLFWYFLIDQFAYMKIFNFCMLILYLVTLVNFFIVHSNLYCIFLHLWGYVF